MFENLKQHITKQNLHQIKKKNRYLEDQFISQKQKQQQTHLHNKYHSNKLQQQIFKNNNKDQQQSDSLSDYQLQQRQQVFNRIQSQPYSPPQKQYIAFADKYYTPENKIKQLEKSVQLSQQKLKLTQIYHTRQINALKQKNERSVQQLNLQIQKLKLIIDQQNMKQQRIKQLQKQNTNLKEISSQYEDKYWRYNEIQKNCIRLQSENKILKLQINRYKQMIKQSRSQNDIDRKGQKQKNIINSINNRQIQQLRMKIKSEQKLSINLQRKLNDNIKQNELDKIYYEQLLSTQKRKIQQLEQLIINKNKSITDCQLENQKIKNDKQKIQKSYLMTMDSFSKHLLNQSSAQNAILISQQHSNKSMSRQQFNKSLSQQDQQNKLKPFNQQTINLDEQYENNSSLSFGKNKVHQLGQVSPVTIKKDDYYQYESNIGKFNNSNRKYHYQQQKLNNQNINKIENRKHRIISHNVTVEHRKNIRDNNYYGLKQNNINKSYDPEKNDQYKIQKLQQKLKLANKKIVQLLKNKLQRSIQ